MSLLSRKSVPRDRIERILGLALPVIGGMMSQNIANLIDTAMVGALGDAALAGVGTGGFLAFMCVALCMGLSSGVQAMVARRFGEGRHDEVALPMQAALVLAMIIGATMTGLFYFAIPTIFPLINPDPAVVAQGVPYVQARLISTIAVGITFGFRGFYNGINQPGVYTRAIVLTQVTNVFFNYCLIFGNLGFPELGAWGAGVSTSISLYVGCAYTRRDSYGFGRLSLKWSDLKTLARLALPSGIQQMLFAASYTVMFWIIGHVGVTETAAANVLINIMLVGLLPAIGLGIAAASLVGQALGKQNPQDARQWGWDVSIVTFWMLLGFGAPAILIPGPILSLFIHNPETLELARVPLQLFGTVVAVDGFGIVLLQALLGAGDTLWVMRISIVMQWLVFLPLAWWIGPVWGYGLLGIWLLQGICRAVQSGVLVVRWKSDRWANIAV